MKKLLFISLVILTIFVITPMSCVYGAASMSVSSSSVNVGSTITVTVNFSGVGSWDATITPSGLVDSGAKKIVGDTGTGYNGSGSGSVTFTTTGTGTVTFTLSGNTTTEDLQKQTLSGSKSVNVVQPTQTTTTTTTTTTTKTTANLKRLVPAVEGLTPNFNANTTKYTLIVPTTLNTLDISVAVETTGSKYWISGNEDLKNGDNTVTITVTATDGTKKVYTIIVTKAADANKAIANLTNIVVDGYKLSPDFTSENYIYDLGEINYDVSSLNVLAYAQSDKAKVDITGNKDLVAGENTIKITVTAEDGKTIKEYTLKVTKKENTAVAATSVTETQNLLNVSEATKTDSTSNKNWILILFGVIALVQSVVILILYKKLEQSRKVSAKKVSDNIDNKTEINNGSNLVKEDADIDNSQRGSSRRRNTSFFDFEKVESKTREENKVSSEDVSDTKQDYQFEKTINSEVEPKPEKTESSDDESVIKKYLKDINIE